MFYNDIRFKKEHINNMTLEELENLTFNTLESILNYFKNIGEQEMVNKISDIIMIKTLNGEKKYKTVMISRDEYYKLSDKDKQDTVYIIW